ncbi:MAG: SPW repeat domain-containing protein [Woeseiaceae bacterium]
MKFLNAKLHGLGDYAAAVVLIIAPFILGISEQSMIAHWASVVGGAGLIVYSLLTDYTFSAVNAIPFRTHLLLDSIAGVAFVALPFVLGLDGLARIYLVVMGVGVLLVVAVSQTDGNVKDADNRLSAAGDS